MCELSIIIVNYKNEHLIKQCVQSIVENESDLSYEIIVVDNNSQDDTEAVLRSICPAIKWIQMGYNSGFGRANNAGILVADGKYILLLNSDIIVSSSNTISACLHHYKQITDHEKCVMGVRLVNTDGSYQETLRLLFPGLKCEITTNALYILLFDRFFKRRRTGKDEQYDAHFRSGEVCWINGAFLMMHRESLLNHQLFFDEDFFLYGEDMEWCWRAKTNGFRFYHWHQPELVHIGSASTSSMLIRYRQIMVSDWLYIRKTRGRLYLFIVLNMVYINLLMDSFFHMQASLRKRRFSEAELQQKKFRDAGYDNLKKFAWLLIFSNKFSNTTTFYTNCYA